MQTAPKVQIVWETTFCVSLGLGKNLKDDSSLTIFQDIDGFLVGKAFEGDAVDRENLVAAFEFAVLGGRARLEDGLDVDGHVAVRAAEAADN